MKALAHAHVFLWLHEQKPDANVNDLLAVAKQQFGEIERDSQMGYGEGCITITFPKIGVSGSSGGLCTSEEALVEAVYACLQKIEFIHIGTKVLVTVTKNVSKDWNKDALVLRKPQGQYQGVVVKQHDSHGLCYEVQFEDGTISCYDPHEVEPQ